MERFLKVVSVGDLKKDKRGREYYSVSFRLISMVGGISVLSNQKPITRVIWGAFTDNEGREFPADGLFTALKDKELAIGGLVEGQIVRVSTSNYEIDGKTVNSLTTVVFSNEDLVKQVNSQLKQNKAVMKDDDGNNTADVEQFKTTEAVTAK